MSKQIIANVSNDVESALQDLFTQVLKGSQIDTVMCAIGVIEEEHFDGFPPTRQIAFMIMRTALAEVVREHVDSSKLLELARVRALTRLRQAEEIVANAQA